MSRWEHPRTVADLCAIRNAFGQNMSGLVPSTGVYILEDGCWIALTGARDPSYNLALVYDGDVGKNVSAMLDHVTAAQTRAVVMLAGRGLRGATILADAGWVCVGSSSLRALPNRPCDPDEDVRELAESELGAARSLAEELFGVDADSAASVYSAGESRSKRLVVGLFDGEEVRTAAMLSLGAPVSTVWAAGTRRDGQRRGNGLRVMRQVSAAAYAAVGEGVVCGLSSTDGERLYDVGGARIVEYWQMWSRPRWLLGN